MYRYKSAELERIKTSDDDNKGKLDFIPDKGPVDSIKDKTERFTEDFGMYIRTHLPEISYRCAKLLYNRIVPLVFQHIMDGEFFVDVLQKKDIDFVECFYYNPSSKTIVFDPFNVLDYPDKTTVLHFYLDTYKSKHDIISVEDIDISQIELIIDQIYENTVSELFNDITQFTKENFNFFDLVILPELLCVGFVFNRKRLLLQIQIPLSVVVNIFKEYFSDGAFIADLVNYSIARKSLSDTLDENDIRRLYEKIPSLIRRFLLTPDKRAYFSKPSFVSLVTESCTLKPEYKDVYVSFTRSLIKKYKETLCSPVVWFDIINQYMWFNIKLRVHDSSR